MMSDAKALRYARLLKQYCNERPCRDGGVRVPTGKKRHLSTDRGTAAGGLAARSYTTGAPE